MGRATLNLIEPHMYVAYMLNFKDNISIDRAINMWDDCKTTVSRENQHGYSHDYSLHRVIKWRIEEHLKEFWSAQGLKKMSKAPEVVDFFKKHSKNYSWWRGLKHSLWLFFNNGYK